METSHNGKLARTLPAVAGVWHGLDDARAGDQMQRISIQKPGDRSQLRLETVADLTPGPGQVRVAVRAIGVNFADIAIRLGLYESAKKYVGWPITPGFETAGVIDAVGPGAEPLLAAQGLAVGSAVIAVSRFFGYASQVVVPANQLLALPEGWSFSQGAAFPVAYLTAWYALHHAAHAAAGERVLVHSAAGGVGQALVQLAVAQGCRVMGTVGSADKVAVVKSLGAEAVVVRSERALWPAVQAWAKDGVDVILDANGVETLAEDYRHLAPAGRLVVYGHASMLDRGGGKTPLWKLAWRWLQTPRWNPLQMTTQNKSVLAFNLSFLFDRVDMMHDALVFVLGRVAAGQAGPLPVQEFALANVADAHLALESGKTQGKLVLIP